MKKFLVRGVSLLVLLGMLLCCFACMDTDDEVVAESTDTVAVTEGGLKLPFGEESYNKDFTVLYYTGSIYKNFYFDDVTEAGDVIEFALVERRTLVQDYLGVNVKGVAESSSESSIQTALIRETMAGLDTYQMALTHGYIGLGAL